MMKKGILIFIAILFSGLFLTGCGIGQNPTTADEVFSGTQALVMNFMDGAPISTPILSEESLIVNLELRNRGAYPIEDGIIYLDGYDKNLITGLKDDELVPYLDGKTQYNTEGGFDIVDFSSGDVRFNLPNEMGKEYTPTLVATACYFYHGAASPVICVDPNVGASTMQKACNANQATTMAGGQGGPIAITSITPAMTPTQAIFTITMQNVGGGDLMDPFEGASIHGCNAPNLPYSNFNSISDFSATLGNNNQGDCTPSKIRFSNGIATVVCKFDISEYYGSNAFQTPLMIEYSYIYRQSISKQITIKRLV